MTLVMLACLFITFATLIYVFYLPANLYLGEQKTRVSYLRERRDVVYENLRDLNFEYNAGKFPEADYRAMKASLEEEAAAVLAEIAHLDEAAEAGTIGRKKGVRS
jgi:hypothetical protein